MILQRAPMGRRLMFGLLTLLAAMLWQGELQAREIKLGGGQKADKPPPIHPVELPPIMVALPKGDGGWRHIEIIAYLMAKDEQTCAQLDEMRTSIQRHAVDEDIPATGFDKLKTPYGGEEAAKKAIQKSTEKSLKRPFDGQVYLRKFLAY